MSNTRNLADLLDSGGDIKSSALDNVPATDISGKLNLTGGTLTGTLTMESTDAGNSAAPELILYRNSASPANGDYLGQVQFKGENANGAQEIYAKVTGKISDPTHNSEDGLIETAIKGNGSFTIVSRQKSDELQLLNGVNLNVDGNIVVGGTVDGVDIQTLNTTAGAALPKAGGTMTGNIAHAGAFTIDTVGDISLDSEGAILIKNGGSAIGRISNSSSDMIIKSDTSDKDILFKGNDGGSTITALKLDMSDAGAATFNSYVDLQGNNLYLADSGIASFGTGEDLKIYHDHANQQNKLLSASLPVILGGSVVYLNNGASDENMLKATANGSVDLYYDNSKKLETTATGISVTGDISAAGFSGDGVIDTISTVDPTITTNPSAVGHIWFNKTSGNIFTCTRNTSNENVWVNARSSKSIRYQKTNGTSDLFGDGSDKLHLRFNESLASAGTVKDYSGNFTCTAHQNVDFTTDSMFSSHAAQFNGNGEITIPFMSNTFRRTDDFTISIWITRKGNIPDGALPFSFNGTSSTHGRGVRVTGNNIYRVSTTAANTMHSNFTNGATFTVNDGDHFVLIGYGDSTNKLYKNGSLVGTTGAATLGHSNVSNSAGGCLGGIGAVYNPTGNDSHTYYQCTVNNFRIFNRTVSSTEVATLYAEGY